MPRGQQPGSRPMGEGTRAIAGEQDVRRLEQAVQGVARVRVVEVEQRGAFARSGVDVLRLDLRQVGQVDAQDVTAKVGRAFARRPDRRDAGEVQYPRSARHGGASERLPPRRRRRG